MNEWLGENDFKKLDGAWDEGYAAALAGKANDNPYPEESRYYYSYDLGFATGVAEKKANES